MGARRAEGGRGRARHHRLDRPARPGRPAPAPDAEREADFLRAGADWMWETDDALRLTTVSPAAAAAAGRAPAQLVGQQLTRLFRLEEGEEGELPLLTALAEQRRFDGQLAELRGGRGGRYRLAGIPLIDGAGRFAGFRGSAAALPAGAPAAPAAAGAASGAGRLRRAARQGAAGAARPDHRQRRDDRRPGGGADPDRLCRLCRRHRHRRPPSARPGRRSRRPAGDRAARFPSRRRRRSTSPTSPAAPPACSPSAPASGRSGSTRPATGESLPAAGDFRRALQIVVNLLTNAIRYSPEGGQVWIRTDREGDLAALIIADQGKGISAEDQERIFEKFERVDPTEAGGTGLGLYIARRLARAMGGDVAVDSAPGQGARFTFTLPLRRE